MNLLRINRKTITNKVYKIAFNVVHGLEVAKKTPPPIDEMIIRQIIASIPILKRLKTIKKNGPILIRPRFNSFVINATPYPAKQLVIKATSNRTWVEIFFILFKPSFIRCYIPWDV